MGTPPRYPDNAGWSGAPDPFDTGSKFGISEFMIRQLMAGLATATLAVVKSVDAAALQVSIQPLVNQMTGQGQPVAHGIIYGVPFIRLQAADRAVILDPVAGDIGLVVFCSRDISAVKSNKAASNPGSLRQFSWADGIYVGGVLNGAPAQYVKISEAGIEITSTTKITLTAPDVEIAARLLVKEDAHFEQDVQIDGDVNNGGTGIGRLHTHTGVVPGGGNSGPVTP